MGAGKQEELKVQAITLNSELTKTMRVLTGLPRQGFAKRFGVSRLLELDRAVGRLPDPRVSYRTPEYFVSDHDLEEELSNSDLILNVCQLLLQQLEQFLLTRQLAVQRICFSIFHLQHPATSFPLGCVQADRHRQGVPGYPRRR